MADPNDEERRAREPKSTMRKSPPLTEPDLPLSCPVCLSLRVKLVARLQGRLGCCCDCCGAEFTMSSEVDTPILSA
jgi:hypothetical protein